MAYEMARAVENEALAPPPLALFVAAVSPPDMYALAVMKLYMTRPLDAAEPEPLQEVLAKLRGWESLPRETVMLVCIRLTRLRVRGSVWLLQLTDVPAGRHGAGAAAGRAGQAAAGSRCS